MDEKETMKTEEPQGPKPASAPSHYDSNPFTAAWSGIQKLAHTNGSTVIGVALFNILLFALMGVTAVLLVLAIGAFVLKRAPDLQAWITDQAFLDFLNSISDTSIYATWILGLGACIFFMALTQSLQLNLTVAAARGVAVKFGALLKASVRSVPPILGLISLVILAMIVFFLAIALLSTVLGIITFLVGVVAVFAAIYVGIRLSYASYSIVDLRLGPVAAMKHSWKISSGHLIETVGSAAVASLILTVPSIILNALARLTESAPTVSGLFGLLELVLMVVLVIGAAMSVAERYVQLQAVETKQLTATSLNPFNYLAIVALIFLSFILNSLTPKMESQQSPFPYNLETTEPSSELQDGEAIYRFN
ncbi:MAG TPA: hypothetical protein VJM46_02145 [Candidatus Saccharimonadales bacterium]|nr:hypothetical protein [Candidatus Saccharimonadales bacterium]